MKPKKLLQKRVLYKMALLIDIKNQKFGKLFVLEQVLSRRTETKNSYTMRAYWKCICDCGKETEVSGHCLRNGSIKSCGCVLKSLPQLFVKGSPGDASYNYIYKNYLLRAKKKGFIFSLNKKEFFDLIKQNCYYCGALPRNFNVYYNNKTKTKNLRNETKELAWIKVNTIDRKNSNLGYVLENCVPCCIICNQAKMDTPYTNWIEYLNNLVNHRKSL